MQEEKLKELREEFLKLKSENILYSDKEVIRKILSSYLDSNTSGIYVYLGTYKKTCEKDIKNSNTDQRVPYSSGDASYRLYQDLEQSFEEKVPIKKCRDFESNHTIINPNSYFKDAEFYKIREEYFTEAVLSSQEKAKSKVLRRYSKLKSI